MERNDLSSSNFDVEIMLDTVCDPLSVVGAQWERLVKQLPESGFMQSLHWARFKQSQGMRLCHILVRHAGDIVGGALLYTAERNNGAGILIAADGPVLPWPDDKLAIECLRRIEDAAESVARELGAMALRIEPKLPMPAPPLLRDFGRAQVDLNPKETLYLQIGPSVEDVLSTMRHKGRYNIGCSERRGVRVIEDHSPDAVRRFYNLVCEAGQRNGFLVEPQDFFTDLVEVLRPAGMVKIFFAELEGDLLGTLLLVPYGRRATYLYGGISSRKREAMCGYALQWAAIQGAKECGCVEYDMYGFDQFRSPDNEYARFSQFKAQFGGEVMRFIGAHDHFFTDDLAGAVIKAIKQTQVL